ncbi:iron ABC transporter permease [Idiomarina sp. 29L]|uniref:FecCD family ABC transporter permease n=1 Tax=Idiomarina sp. 29L TaxID=2508877 RepID=UPI0013E983E9|nr:iron ABC transporter permease [Idiomarina sp. 29L]
MSRLMKWMLVLTTGIIALSLWHASQGSSGVTLLDWWQSGTLSVYQKTILVDIRLPRLVLALVNGAALGLAGAAMQLLLRNPLAEPGLTGVSSGAALTTVAVLYFGLLPTFSWLLPFIALAGGLAAIIVVVMMAGGYADVNRVILAGVAISSLAGAAMALLLYLAPNPFAFQEWSQWTLGSLANRGWSHVMLMLPLAFVGAVLVLTQTRFLTALTFSEETVVSMGYSYPIRRNLVLIAVALLTGSSVVSVGIIGFVGLLAPHVVRLLGLGHPKHVLSMSALTGALLVLSIDIFVRLMSVGRELPLGVVAAVIGAPLLIFLLVRQKARHAVG